MADFLVLPPHDTLGEHVAQLLRPLLPGVRITSRDCVQLLTTLAEQNATATHLVHRDELLGDDLHEALRDGFGFAKGDRVTVVKLNEAPVAPIAGRFATLEASSTPIIR